ncbi:MAG TPA: hypothetical protein VGX46_11720, partial [Vicinamibacterales bacterium]|nr:hypothetical protein [Vicinamibacterales bacterium]
SSNTVSHRRVGLDGHQLCVRRIERDDSVSVRDALVRSSWFACEVVSNHLAIFHHESNALQFGHVAQRIRSDRDEAPLRIQV